LAVAVGNPLGFTGALTTGVVHAVGPFAGLGGKRRWVQAGVRLAPGNSGGPLADAEGRLIGINTMVTSTGIALAVPASAVAAFVRNGSGPLLGVTIRPVELGSRRLGLLVLEVSAGSMAAEASLMIGDILIGANGSRFEASADLSLALAESAGAVLKLRFYRGERSREREVAVQIGATRKAAA
jgi:serine protease Do